MMIGRILNDGRLTGRIKYDINDAMSLKLQTQLTQEKGYSQMMADLDVKVWPTAPTSPMQEPSMSESATSHYITCLAAIQGQDWNGQFKMGNAAFYGNLSPPPSSS